MKLPRDVSASELINLLNKIDYRITRQKGSHIRLTISINSEEHHLTIPNHSPIKIGTLNNILNDIASQNGIAKEEIIKIIWPDHN